MKWVKKGLIFKVKNNYSWMQTHAQFPVADIINQDRLRIYFSTRDGKNRSHPTYIEVMADDPQKILYVHNKPIIGLGKLGCFDDNGVMPVCIVNYKGKKYLYYLGWNICKTVPYHNSLGLAISDDNGRCFYRLYEGPILDRTYFEPHFVGAAYITIENDVWRMWYNTATGWKIHDGKPEPYYHIRYAESKDGIHWMRNGVVCIDYKSSSEGSITSPSVLKEDGIYKMWYCYRGARDYRTDKNQSYRIGYAESQDGINWLRKDDSVGIDVSENGWDSQMIAYPNVYRFKGKTYMLYNGNGFGKTGFGYAILE